MIAGTESPQEAAYELLRRKDLKQADPLYMYYTMLLARALSERMWMLARQGKTLFAVTGDGHEGGPGGKCVRVGPGQRLAGPILPRHRLCPRHGDVRLGHHARRIRASS